MSCLPRFLRQRQKNSFTPERDENTDTILNTSESTVQIGRYIRRDETGFFTPKPSCFKPTQQRQAILADIQKENGNSKVATAVSPSQAVTANGGIKKFTSNKIRPTSVTEQVSANNTSSLTPNGSVTHFARHHHQNSINSKLKPVKERRPTALPSEQPKFTDDEDERQQLEVLGEQEEKKYSEIDKQKSIKFFIGNAADGEDETDAEDEYDKAKKESALNQRNIQEETTSQSYNQSNNKLDNMTMKENSSQSNILQTAKMNKSNNISRTTITSVTSTNSIAGGGASLFGTRAMSATTLSKQQQRQQQQRAASLASTCSNPQCKFLSSCNCNENISTNKSRKFDYISRKQHSSELHGRAEKENENLNIPPAPPLPPPEFCRLNSVISITPSKTSVSQRHSIEPILEGTTVEYNKSSESAVSSPQNLYTLHEILQSGKIVINQFDNDDTSPLTAAPILFQKIKKYSSASVIIDNGVLISHPSLTSACSDAITVDRDSGVQIEESLASSAKESETNDLPKSHRAEGGLIFTRTNLPIKKDVTIEYIEKDENTRNLIRTAIEKNDFLNNYMDRERKEMVIDAMELEYFESNSFIINENDEGSEIYVSEEGEFDVIKGDAVIARFGPATVFGELAILYNAKRFASIKAITKASVWKIDRDKFRKIMVISGSKEREENLSFLRSAPFLNDLSEDVLDKVVDLLQKKFYVTGACIVREGDIGNEFFIIRCGTVTIKKKNEAGEERIVDRRQRGDYFGEQALLNADCRQASVFADAPGTEVLKLDREFFISYLGTIPQLRELPVEKRDSDDHDSQRKSEFDNEYSHIELTDLKKIATLGSGAFGKVDLVSHGDVTFALKIVKKIDIVKQDQIEHIYSEKHVMMKCRDSPFIIELYKTFRNDKFVYFLMEACMGGDVWTVMSQRRFFDEKTARFIAGCVVEAFDFLHSHHIIYRDLKPENLMLTTDGYCKLVDFGFAKHIPKNQKTNTFAGTPEYVAPEIILDRGHDRSVDYWALGILIFELLMGKTPFRGHNQIKIYQQILGGIDVVQMPSKIPKSAQNLIKALCKQLPAERLGYQRKGIADIKKHSWFDSLDWQKLKAKQLTSPIKRPITSNRDIQHFGPPGVENDHDPPSETSGWDIDF